MQIVLTESEKLLKYLPFVTSTECIYEKEKVKKVVYHQENQNLIFYDSFLRPYLFLDLQNHYEYKLNLFYVKNYVPKLNLKIEHNFVQASPLHRS